MLRFSGVGESHIGLVRPDNEDAAYAGADCLLVADGVGGGAAGEIASATAAHAVATTVARRAGDDPAHVLADGIRLAQRQVRAGVLADAARAGMATTLTAVVTDGVRFALGHLGDSRGYVVRAGRLIRVTRDHTYVQDLLEEGRLQPADVADHPWRNVVLRTVNGTADGEPDLIDLQLQAQDRVLLASDGLTDLVSEAELEHTVLGRSDDDAVATLIAAALGRGGKDNITCVLGTVVEGASVLTDGTFLGAAIDPANVVDRADPGQPDAETA